MHKKQLVSLAAGALLALAGLNACADTATVKIIGINDFHGNMQKYGYMGAVAPGGSCLTAPNTSEGEVPRPCQDALDGGASPGTSFSNVPIGGADYLAGYVDYLKSKNPRSVVVSAGDLIGASPLISAIFHDEGTIEVMNRLGLEINAVGNHEFDEGKDELLRMQNGGCHPTDTNTCQGASVGTPVPFEGAKFHFLAANVVNAATGRTLFPAYHIKEFPIARDKHCKSEYGKYGSGKCDKNPHGGWKHHRDHDKDEVKIAFIGMTLKETPTIVTPTGVAGLEFKDEADTVNALIPKLKKRGVDAVVVLIHQGGFQRGTPTNDINGCTGNLDGDPIKNIVNKLDDRVDLVISGHTHAYYNCQLATRNGTHMIPVTSTNAFARVLSDIDMSFDTHSGKVVGVVATNRVVARNNSLVTADAEITGIVDKYNTLVSPIANQVIGSITTDATNIANDAGEMDAGDLIADAQLAATSPSGFGEAVIAFMNAGGVRNPGFLFSQVSGTESAGDITYGEAFTVQPFGNSLVTMTLTGQQIKDLLEQQFPGCMGQTTKRIMQVSNGFSYSWSDSAPACSKISNMVLNGQPINPADNYRVTVNNFMSTGGDGFAVLLGGTNLLGGSQDIDALVAYMSNFKSPNAPYDPAESTLHKPRITKLP